MFGTTDELLVRGVAAARDNDRDEARFYPEWVLRDGPAAAQYREAWYWLSRIAAEPTHAEARRDLAILDGRLRQSDLLDPWAAVAPLTPAATLTAHTAHCPKCGGALLGDAAHGELRCQFCGYRGSAGAATPTEQDWEAAIYTARGHRWVVPGAVVRECRDCGATQTLPAGEVSATCAFCGSPAVVAIAAPDDPIPPKGIAPSAFDAGEVRRRMHDRLAARHFRPGAPDERARLATPRPIFLPFWTLDLEGQIRWHGVVDSGHGRRPVSGEERRSDDDLLVPGGQALPGDVLLALRYDTSRPSPYTPEVLAGWPAELYRVAVADASLSARAQALGDLRARIVGPHGQRVDDLAVESSGLAVVSYKLVLLPVWIGAYRYAGDAYRLIPNGQSGQAHGAVPRGPFGRLLAWLTDDEGGR